MRTIRNAYQKLVKAQPSGSEAVGKTDRQREIIRLASFLRDHVKTVATITSYKGRSPATKKMYSHEKVPTHEKVPVKLSVRNTTIFKNKQLITPCKEL